MLNTIEDKQIVSIARRITWIGFVVNAILATSKIVGGLYGNSDALFADGIHSLSDFATDIIVIVFIGLAHRRADNQHPYGYGKYEVLATLLVAMALVVVGLGIGYNGVDAIVGSFHGEPLVKPTMITLWIAMISILSKEWLYQLTARTGKRLKSGALIANAWHHRTDALSSVATVLGIGGAIFLGEDWLILDPIATVIISLFIIVSAYSIGKPAIMELLESALPIDMIDEIRNIIVATDGVKSYHHLRTRQNGNTIIIDFHIKVDPDITLRAAHDIATNIEREIRARYGENTIVNSHVEPYGG
jgi:cation diffusion facilitator family transporter